MNRIKQIITRFAPSPTGLLHLGGARTALFNWLYAKQNNGLFILRIEDTDYARNTNCEEQILNDLNWLNLSYDSLYRQSDNIAIHIQVAFKLLEIGAAYKCYLTQEELDKMRNKGQKIISPWRERNECLDKPYTIRIKIPINQEYFIGDNIQGEIKVKSEVLDDLIILRSNQQPTYIFASMVDDYLQSITDIIRGNDHLTNTIKQQPILQALGWDVPNYYHVPLIADSFGAKLSKRKEGITIMSLREQGYIPAGIINTCVRLGWSHENTETINLDELLKIFHPKNINKAQARFDEKKLDFFNTYHLKQESPQKILSQINSKNWDQKIALQLMPEVIKRVRTLKDIEKLLAFCDINFHSGIYPSKELRAFIQSLNFESLEEEFKALSKDKLYSYSSEIRLMITGKQESLGAYQLLIAYGKEKIINKYFL